MSNITYFYKRSNPTKFERNYFGFDPLKGYVGQDYQVLRPLDSDFHNEMSDDLRSFMDEMDRKIREAPSDNDHYHGVAMWTMFKKDLDELMRDFMQKYT